MVYITIYSKSRSYKIRSSGKRKELYSQILSRGDHGDQHGVWRIQYRNRIYDTFSVAIHDRYILYDRWRYRYPEFDNTQRWVKVPSQELSDMLVEALKDEIK